MWGGKRCRDANPLTELHGARSLLAAARMYSTRRRCDDRVMTWSVDRSLVDHAPVECESKENGLAVLKAIDVDTGIEEVC